jgi:hypothetical protein
MQILYILYIYIRTRKVLSFVKYLRCLLYYLRWNIYSQTCHYILSFALWCPLRFPHRNDVRFVFTSSVGGFMSYLRYLCLFTYIGVQHRLCCVFVLIFVVFCTLCCEFLWNIHFWFDLTVHQIYSCTFLLNNNTPHIYIYMSLWTYSTLMTWL